MHRLLPLLVVAAASAPDEQVTRAQALAAFRAHRLKDACALYEAASRQAPDDASNWADLGFCLARLGEKAGALSAEQKAARLAPDQETRLHAYYNLYKLGVTLHQPKNDPGHCATWGDAGNSATLGVCDYDCTEPPPVGDEHSGLVICPTQQAASRIAGDQTGAFFDDSCALRRAPDCFAFEEDVQGYHRVSYSTTDSELVESGESCTFVFADGARHRVGAWCARFDDTPRTKKRALEIGCTGDPGCRCAHPDWAAQTRVEEAKIRGACSAANASKP